MSESTIRLWQICEPYGVFYSINDFVFFCKQLLLDKIPAAFYTLYSRSKRYLFLTRRPVGGSKGFDGGYEAGEAIRR